MITHSGGSGMSWPSPSLWWIQNWSWRTTKHIMTFHDVQTTKTCELWKKTPFVNHHFSGFSHYFCGRYLTLDKYLPMVCCWWTETFHIQTRTYGVLKLWHSSFGTCTRNCIEWIPKKLFKTQDQNLSIVQCLLNFTGYIRTDNHALFSSHTSLSRDQSSHPHPGCVYSPAVQVKVVWAMQKVLQEQFFTTPELMRQLWSCLGDYLQGFAQRNKDFVSNGGCKKNTWKSWKPYHVMKFLTLRMAGGTLKTVVRLQASSISSIWSVCYVCFGRTRVYIGDC